MKLSGGPDPSGNPAQDGPHAMLFAPPPSIYSPSAGASIATRIRQRGLQPSAAAWDFLAIALTAVVADFYVLRSESPDGWTRDIEIDVAVACPDRWGHIDRLSASLDFLTTDRWTCSVRGGGAVPARPRRRREFTSESVALLSGGTDSLIGALDLIEQGVRPLAVSHMVRGDGATQRDFAQRIGSGLERLQLNHNARTGRRNNENSQRARSLLFIALAVVAASTLPRHQAGERVPIYLNENGFIAINPPLTIARLGSLSTRTTHPIFLKGIQAVLDEADMRVDIVNPYQLQTKGEMLAECLDQSALSDLATMSTSCGRFQRYGYQHCGRCLPCQIRRAAFIRWGQPDSTDYRFVDLGQQDADHAAFDDVRAVSVALAQTAQPDGIARLIGPALSGIGDLRNPIASMLERGFGELRELHARYQVI